MQPPRVAASSSTTSLSSIPANGSGGGAVEAEAGEPPRRRSSAEEGAAAPSLGPALAAQKGRSRLVTDYGQGHELPSLPQQQQQQQQQEEVQGQEHRARPPGGDARTDVRRYWNPPSEAGVHSHSHPEPQPDAAPLPRTRSPDAGVALKGVGGDEGLEGIPEDMWDLLSDSLESPT